MNRIASLAAICAAVSGLGACATVTRGSHAAWVVHTMPAGASVTTSTNNGCDATPCALRMARGTDFDATITKQGYKPRTIHVTHKVSTDGVFLGVAGNLLIAGGLVGVGVDVATGAMYDLHPNDLEVALEKDASTPVADMTTYPHPRPAAYSAPVQQVGGYRNILPCGETAYPTLCVKIRPSYAE